MLPLQPGVQLFGSPPFVAVSRQAQPFHPLGRYPLDCAVGSAGKLRQTGQPRFMEPTQPFKTRLTGDTKGTTNFRDNRMGSRGKLHKRMFLFKSKMIRGGHRPHILSAMS